MSVYFFGGFFIHLAQLLIAAYALLTINCVFSPLAGNDRRTPPAMNFCVTAEHAPLRCEICHQADCFDAATGVCARCAALVVVEQSPKKNFGRPVRLFSSATFGEAPGAIAYRGFFYAAFLLSFLAIFWSEFPLLKNYFQGELSSRIVQPVNGYVNVETIDRESEPLPATPWAVLDPLKGEPDTASLPNGYLHGLAIQDFLHGEVLQFEGIIVRTEDHGFLIRREDDQRILFTLDEQMVRALDKGEFRQLHHMAQVGNVVRIDCRRNAAGLNVVSAMCFLRRDMTAIKSMSQYDNGGAFGSGIGSTPIGNPTKMTHLCSGYGDLPLFTITGQIMGPLQDEPEGIKHSYAIRTDSGKIVNVTRDNTGITILSGNDYFDRIVAKGNRLKLEVRVLKGNLYVMETIEKLQ